MILSVVLFTTLFCTSCTENQRAKNWGGTADVTLKSGQEFVNATWKGDNLWILVKESDGTYLFQEYSSWGVMNGAYKIKEIK